MAAVVAKYAATKVLSKEMKKYKAKEPAGDDARSPSMLLDPYFMYIPDNRTGKLKKVKKQVPDYITEHDAVILAKMRKRSYALDMSLFNLFGTRFGWSSVIGLIPVFGDLADGLLALALISRCNEVECGLPAGYQTRMYLNVLFDLVVGLVPLVGDFADGIFKANTRNVRLLEKRLDEVYRPSELKKGQPSKNDRPATVYEDFSDEDDDRRSVVRHTDGAVDPQRPAPAKYPDDRRGDATVDRKGYAGFFGGGSRRDRRVDEEMGHLPVQPPRPQQGSYGRSDRRMDGGRS
ncbi:hypothetical protein LTR16_003126 [Cryomyces antarcticus]|uniref:DUF4112 domain-containing protein n=1 Tax=Cryomyces antarcticus TaxID=329879 RepID=A0ABR0LY81_9PEZI|nr:hypothetical protein LTR39_002349 [Cryomyces antarcticus]KAK5256502.1 hypothetical protein LTR16_003126 [Cryomyces antarcticus]